MKQYIVQKIKKDVNCEFNWPDYYTYNKIHITIRIGYKLWVSEQSCKLIDEDDNLIDTFNCSKAWIKWLTRTKRIVNIEKIKEENKKQEIKKIMKRNRLMEVE